MFTFGLNSRNVSAEKLSDRLAAAQEAREDIIHAIIDADDILHAPFTPLDALRLEHLSIQADTLESEIAVCTHELRQLMWAENGRQARAERGQNPARSRGLTGTLRRLFKGSAAHAA